MGRIKRTRKCKKDPEYDYTVKVKYKVRKPKPKKANNVKAKKVEFVKSIVKSKMAENAKAKKVEFVKSVVKHKRAEKSKAKKIKIARYDVKNKIAKNARAKKVKIVNSIVKSKMAENFKVKKVKIARSVGSVVKNKMGENAKAEKEKIAKSVVKNKMGEEAKAKTVKIVKTTKTSVKETSNQDSAPFALSKTSSTDLQTHDGKNKRGQGIDDFENINKIYGLFKKKTGIMRVQMKSDADETSVCNKLCRLSTRDSLKTYIPAPNMRVFPTYEGYTLYKILWAFHTNWISRTIEKDRRTSERNNAVKKSYQIDWLPNFVKYFGPLCQQYFRSRNCSSSFDPEYGQINILAMQVRLVVDAAAAEMTSLSDHHLNAAQSVGQLLENVSTTIQEKDNLCDLLETEYDRCSNSTPKLDEDNIWGLKPLRKFCNPPYFKTADGDIVLAAPAHASTVYKYQYPEVFFCFTKQKWTTKDLVALRQSTRETLIEKRLHQIQNRSDILIEQCRKINEEEANNKLLKEQLGELVDDREEVKPRGRPRRFGQSPYLATIPSHLFTIESEVIEGPIVVRCMVSNNHIEQWRDSEEDKVNKLTLKELLALNETIEWESVSNKVTLKTKKNRSAEDCLSAFRCEGDPRINSSRWTLEEGKVLKRVVQELETPDWCKNNKPAVGVSWEEVAHKAGYGRTEFQCFYRWRNCIAPPKKMQWSSKDQDDRINNLIALSEGNWKKVLCLSGEVATKKQIIDRFKKNSNAILRSGPFSRVEDALLLVTIEKLKGQLRREGHFGELIAYLPWRFETVWRDRAGNLFSDWIVPWTVEEDKKLMELAESKKRNWREIANFFTSFKNRKGCLTRYKILQKRLKTFKNVEEYHEAYSMIRYNVFQYQHLNEILNLLKQVLKERNLRTPFEGFRIGFPPREEDLQDLLLSFQPIIVLSTINSLTKYINRRNELWDSQLQVPAEKKRTFDRRTFREEEPQSVASALHIRGIELIPRNELKISLTTFEEDIYKFYTRFTRTKAVNRKTKRPYLPPVNELIKMNTVKRIAQKAVVKVKTRRES